MDNQKENIDFFKAKCRKNKLRITPQRIAIYKALQTDQSHPSADDVYQNIKAEFPNISFDTVNRTLLSFVDIGLAKIVESFNRQKRFDPCMDNHHHLSCIKCGKIIDFENNDFDEIKIPASIKKKFKVLNKRVVLECICDKCDKKK